MSRTARYLVAGCAGFLGQHLVERLASTGNDVVGVDDFSTGSRAVVSDLGANKRFDFIEADVTADLPISGHFDFVVHLASPAAPPDYQRLSVETLQANSLGTLHLLQLAERAAATFVFASSSEVYGTALDSPQGEESVGIVDPIGARSMYAEAKRFGEALSVAYRHERNVRVRIVRLFNVYGPGMRTDDGRVVTEFVKRALAEIPLIIHGDGQQIRSFTYVDDAIAGVLAVGRGPDLGPVNVGDPGGAITIAELARMVLELSGSTSAIEFEPARADDPRHRVPDIRRAESIGWSPHVPLREGMKTTLEALRSPVGNVAAPR